ncbi:MULTISPECIES: type IV conjugative transfer system pilin TraA [Enterobacter]|uniref:type IV conjugative transfer system pilin TraA n=1 Tax=Enterobacter TaxID=547 RepID=UPI0009BD9F8E|nr:MULTISPECIES: type IV conjugative transfer system pilin TraA [Enterobacter]HAV1851705.1 conjugal transfer protein TraA [Enterobacter hormaechei subsp. xiangfangensis]
MVKTLHKQREERLAWPPERFWCLRGMAGVMTLFPRWPNRRLAPVVLKYLAVSLLLWLAARGMVHAEDLTSAGKADAQDTFGPDSTMMYYFMLAEAVLVFLLYLRNHNPATFLFIPVFIVVTKVVFAIISARSGG